MTETEILFDPVEYLDVLIAAGYEPSVYQRTDGSMAYREMRPRVITETQMAPCNVVWAKCEAAPNGMDKVKAECLRRGLVD